MAFQYYLKHQKSSANHTGTAAAATAVLLNVSAQLRGEHAINMQQQQQPQQQQQQQQSRIYHIPANITSPDFIVQSQAKLSQLQLKHPTSHLQHSSSIHQAHHHHPYYQQQQPQQILQQQQQQQQQTKIVTSKGNYRTQVIQTPVYVLNQNSNFSAASSSTGGAPTTSSSHAPTQQSNTTGSNLSPPGPSVNARNTAAPPPPRPPHPMAAKATTSSAVASTANRIMKTNPMTTNVPGSGASGANPTLVVGNRSAPAASVAAKKLKTEPVLTEYQQTERFNFANTHIVWTEDHWKRIVFQDERKFNLDGPDGFSHYFHDLRNYERTLSQRHRGNSVFVYMIISAGGPIHLNVSTTRQKPESTIETILRERSNIIEKVGNTDFVIQDYNWPANSLPSTQEWISAEGIKTQKWPTIAHDINIMENIWGWLIREVYDGGRKYPRKDDLIYRLREAWARLPMELITNLYSTLPERITELYYTRGVYTNC